MSELLRDRSFTLFAPKLYLSERVLSEKQSNGPKVDRIYYQYCLLMSIQLELGILVWI